MFAWRPGPSVRSLFVGLNFREFPGLSIQDFLFYDARVRRFFSLWCL